MIAALGPAQPGGGDELAALADRVVAENPDKVAGYRGGKVKLFEFFVGQVMRASGGRANPDEIRRLLKERPRCCMICPRCGARLAGRRPPSAPPAACRRSSWAATTGRRPVARAARSSSRRSSNPWTMSTSPGSGDPGARRCTSVPWGARSGPGCGCIGLPLLALAGVVVSSVIALLWVLSLGRLPVSLAAARGAGAPGIHGPAPGRSAPEPPMRVIHCAGRDALTPEEAAAVGAAARAGGVILFPTDTLYGLGVDPRSPAGLAALFRLKGRDPGKPLPVLLADASLVGRYAAAIPAPWRALMERFWPGPLTLLFPALPGLPPGIRSASGKVALRVPGSALCRSVLRAAGGSLTGTSANRRGRRRHGRPGSRAARSRRRRRPVRERGNFAPLPGIYRA